MARRPQQPSTPSFVVKSTSLFRSFFVVSGWTAMSRLSGLCREILMAKLLGAGLFTDIYSVALKLPSFFRRFFAEGALSAVLIPHFSQIMAKEKPEEVLRFARHMLSVLATGLLLFVLLFEAGMPFVVQVMIRGWFKDDTTLLPKVVHYTRIMFPYIGLISLVAYMSSVLNALHRFAWAAAISIIVNVAMILSLLVSLFLGPRISSEGVLHSVMICSLAGGVVQCLILWRQCRRHGMPLRFQKPRWTPEIGKILKAAVPGFLGAGVTQINVFVDMAFASYLPKGSISYLNYADRLNQFPISLLGAALGTALLPTLARLWENGQRDSALRTQDKAFMMGASLTIPAALGLFLMAEPLVALFYGSKRFDSVAIVQTTAALKAFVCGVPFYVLGKLCSSVFFAHKDTVTPMRVTLVAVFLNAALNALLIGPFAHQGIAAATAISALVNALLLLSLLIRKKWFTLSLNSFVGLGQILMAGGLMSVGLIMVKGYLISDTLLKIEKGLAAPSWVFGGAVLACVAVGVTLYFAVFFAFGLHKRVK